MMGGDNAPLAVLEGAAQAVKKYGVQIIGVGNEELVRRTAADNNIPLDDIELVNCTQVIEMCDEPARAIRTKKDSSIVVGDVYKRQGQGLTDETIAACTSTVRIPMTDRVESLNAGIAGSILLWHFRGEGL